MIRTISFLALICMYACNPNKSQVIEEYYTNGVIKSQTTFINNIQEGPAKTFDDHGRLQSLAEYKNGVKEGWLYNYNPLNGKMTAKAFYKNDKQNGTVNLYYTDGQIYREMIYVDGRLDSVVKTYYPGKKLQAENTFKMGQPSINLKEYDKKGKLITQYPTIVVKEQDMRQTKGKYRLVLSLSEQLDRVDFYLNAITKDGFLDDKISPVVGSEGKAFQDYNIPRGTRYSSKIQIVAKYHTELGNTKIIVRNFQLNIR